MTGQPIDDEGRRILRHALGLDRSDVPYRNRYAADPDNEHLAQLELLGLVRRGAVMPGGPVHYRGHVYYHVTEAGKAVAMAAAVVEPPSARGRGTSPRDDALDAAALGLDADGGASEGHDAGQPNGDGNGPGKHHAAEAADVRGERAEVAEAVSGRLGGVGTSHCRSSVLGEGPALTGSSPPTCCPGSAGLSGRPPAVHGQPWHARETGSRAGNTLPAAPDALPAGFDLDPTQEERLERALDDAGEEIKRLQAEVEDLRAEVAGRPTPEHWRAAIEACGINVCCADCDELLTQFLTDHEIARIEADARRRSQDRETQRA